jgi:two-component system sensor histidine kinase EvgS
MKIGSHFPAQLSRQASLVAAILVLPAVVRLSNAQAPADEPWQAHGIELSEAEAQWVRENGSVRMGGDPAWPPFVQFNARTGLYEGADVDLFREAAGRLGLKVKDIPARDWSEIWRMVAAAEIDVVTSTTPTPERGGQMLFTKPYSALPVAIVARRDAPFLMDLQHLAPGMRAAGPSQYITTEQLAVEHPGIPIVQTRTSKEALQKVSRGEADFVVENLGVASHYIRQHRLTNLKIAGFTDERFELCLGVRKDLPLLHSALDKAMASITKAERRTIMGKWLVGDYSPGLKWRGVLIAAGVIIAIAGAVLGALAWHNRRLQEEIEHRKRYEAELRLANDRLTVLNDEKTQFMRMAAHDLKNPLTAILSTAELLLMHQLSRSIDERTAHLLGEVQDSAYRMLRLIRNLLDADAIERGQTNLRPRSMDLRNPVREAITRFRHSAQRKEIALQCASDEGDAVPRIVADPDALARILDNLMSNAIKYSPRKGRVTVRISGPFGSNGDTVVRMEITDSGPGIHPEDRTRVFEPHAQLKTRPTEGEDSSGLGLSIVKRLCAGMGGSIRYEDGEEGGARFVVELPAAEGEPQLSPAT